MRNGLLLSPVENTLLDQFAIASLIAFYASEGMMRALGGAASLANLSPEDYAAEFAYLQARAMMRARER